MSETEIKVEEDIKIESPPKPPASQTIVIPTTSPLLIPENGDSQYCFTRRGIMDIVVGLIIAIGVIYFVMYTGTGTAYFGTGTGTGRGGVFGTSGAASYSKPVTATGIGSGIGQIGGFLKKLFK